MNGSIHAWNRGTSNSGSVSAHVLRIRLEIPSGPGALSALSLWSAPIISDLEIISGHWVGEDKMILQYR